MNHLKFLLIAGLFFAGKLNAQSLEDGKKFMYYERYKSAKEVFQKVVAATPTNEEAAYWLGQAEIGLENVSAAKSLYQNKLTTNPNSPILIAGMGHVALLENNTADAKSRFETAVSLSQNKNITVLNAVGAANSSPDVKNGNPSYAVDVLRKATQLKGFNHPEVYVNLGDAYRKLGDGGSALQAYNAALAINPNYAWALYRIGKMYQTQGVSQQDLYLQYFNDAIAKDSKYAPVYSNLMTLYFQTDVKKSAEYLDKWLANADEDPKACSYRASMKYAQGLFNDAIAQADFCIKEEGANPYPNLYGIKALAYNRMNDSLNAKLSYEQYFKIQAPDKLSGGDYASYAAVLLKFPGNEATAATLVDRAIQLDSLPENKVSYIKSLAGAFDKQGKFKEAGDWYSKVLIIKRNPSNLDIYNAAYSYYKLGDYTTAAVFFTQYTTKYPNDIFGYFMLGKNNQLLDSTGALGLAVAPYQKVVEIGEAAPDKNKVKPQLSTAYRFFIEYAYNIKKDKTQALQWLDKALVLEPSDEQLIANKEFISKNDPNAVRKPAKSATPDKPVKSATPTKSSGK